MYSHQKNTKKISYVIIFSLLWSFIFPLFPTNLVEAAGIVENSEGESHSNRHEPIELQEYRTSNSKRILNPDGSFTEEIYVENIHFKKGKKWEEIYNSLVPSNNGEYAFKNKANRFTTEFASQDNGNRFVRFAVGEHAIEMRPIGLLTRSGQVNGNKITYDQEETGEGLPVKLKYTVGNDNLKEDIVLDQYKKINRLTFQLRLENITYKKEEDGSIGFYKPSSNERVWYL